MAWKLKGSYVETCSCELMCPCNMSFDHGATYDYCRVTLVFDIKEGDIEGTDVDGRKVAVIADTPKVMTEGNWRIGMFVDDGASDDQMEKLTAVFGGQKSQNRVGGKSRVVGPQDEFRAVAGGQDDNFLNSFRPGKPHQGFATSGFADPETLPHRYRSGAVVQADDHECGFQDNHLVLRNLEKAAGVPKRRLLGRILPACN